MTFTEAAAEVLRIAGKPLHYTEITELAIEKNLLSHVGKSPEVTMGARLAALIKKEDDSLPIVRVRPGVFALRDWKNGTDGKHKVDAGQASAAATATAGTEVNALEVGELESRADAEANPADAEDAPAESPADAMRADLAAGAADVFDDEEDDDRPILAPSSADVAAPVGEGGRRRRRRRRRRGGEGREGGVERAAVVTPTAIVSVEADSQIDASRDPLAPAPSPRPLVRDRQQIMAGGLPSGIDVPLGEGDELAGHELADAALIVFTAFDRNGGPVALRSIVEALMRRGRLSGDPAMAATQLSASLRADNLRRGAAGLRPRFRFSNGSRVAPTEWMLGQELVRLEQEAIAAVERYREGSRRMLLRRIQELPGHAFVELVLLAIEQRGMTGVKVVKRAGSPGGEAHFAGIHKTGSDEIRTAIVVRKDGREIGRERVGDVRGSLHHYGPATAGWLLTTGQVLSGAREEAGVPNAPPIALYDGMALCKLLEESDVGVVRTRMTVAIPDLELLETLRA